MLGKGGLVFPVVIEITSDGPHWLQIAAWAGQLLLVVVGAASLTVAALALRASALARKGALLLQLDARFDQSELQEGRMLMRTKLDEVKTAVLTANALATDDRKDDLIRNQWATELAALRAEDPTIYMKMITVAGFFETVGMMVWEKYISAKDAFFLFEGPILEIETAFRRHAADRIANGAAPGFLEHAFKLAEEVKKMAAQRAAKKT